MMFRKDGGNTPPTPVPRPDPNAVSPGDQEVFNISNNLYTYEDAPAVCKAFGATLATAKQVEQAYQNGADWCNYIPSEWIFTGCTDARVKFS